MTVDCHWSWQDVEGRPGCITMLGWTSTTRAESIGLRRRTARPESAVKVLCYLVAMAFTSAVIAMVSIQLISAIAFS